MEVVWDAEPDTSAAIVDGKPDRPRKMTFKSMAADMMNGTGSSTESGLLRGSAMIVVVSLALLWLLGGVVFKNARL